MAQLRNCLSEPVPEIYEAARLLDAAVSAHLAGDRAEADNLIMQADIPAVRIWTNSLWGPGGPWSRPVFVQTAVPSIPKAQRTADRMPTKAKKQTLLQRDGHRCRFCEIPLIRTEIRERIRKAYPEALYWGSRNSDQHAAFQALWLQYDHIVPHARGGSNDLSNMLITCAPCNYGRWHLLLEEVGLLDPRDRPVVTSNWDGLERFV